MHLGERDEEAQGDSQSVKRVLGKVNPAGSGPRPESVWCHGMRVGTAAFLRKDENGVRQQPGVQLQVLLEGQQR